MRQSNSNSASACNIIRLLLLAATAAIILTPASNAIASELQAEASLLWRGMNDVVVEGDVAFGLFSWGVQAISIADPTAPQIKSEYPLLGSAADRLVKQGNFVYVTGEGPDLTVLRVDDGHTLRFAGRLQFAATAIDLDIQAEVLAVLCADGIRIFDVSDPGYPDEIGFYSTAGSGSAIKLSGDRLFAALSDGRAHIIDITDPTIPQLLGMTGSHEKIKDLDVQGNYLYLAAYYDRLKIYDVSAPASPLLVGSSLGDGWLDQVIVRDSLAFVDNARHGLQIFDVKTPSSPKLVSTVNTPGYYIECLYYTGNRIYVAAGYEGLQAYDVANPGAPTWIINYFVDGYARSATFKDGILVVSDGWAGIKVYRSDDLSSFTLAGTWSHAGCTNCEAWTSVISNRRIYTYFLSPGEDYLRIFGFESETDTLELLAEYPGDWAGLPLAEVGKDTILMTLPGRKIAVTIADDPNNLQILSFVSEDALDAEISGDTAYVSLGGRGAIIVDLSDRLLPREIARFPYFPRHCHWDDAPGIPPFWSCEGRVYEVNGREGTVFATSEWGGLLMSSFPGGSDSLASEDTGLHAATASLEILGNRLFQSFNYNLYVYDVTEPNAPALLESVKLPNYIYDLDICSGKLIVAALGSVLIYSINTATPVIEDSDEDLPKEFRLAQNYPNPFNGSTSISIQTKGAPRAELSVFNLLGQRVATLLSGPLTPGTHDISWNGTDDRGRPVASGVYFYKLVADEFIQTRKMLYLK